jgi:hypothetical protein
MGCVDFGTGEWSPTSSSCLMVCDDANYSNSAKTGGDLKRNFRRLCLCSWFRMESRPPLCQHPLQILLIFLSNNLSGFSVALRVVALVVLTAAEPRSRPPSPARSIEGRLVQGGPGLAASSDCCGEPPAAALRLPATSNINEIDNGRNIGSPPSIGGIADPCKKGGDGAFTDAVAPS